MTNIRDSEIKIDLFFERWADRFIWLFIFCYIAIFSYVCYLKFSSFGYYDWDFASDVIVYWNSVHGNFLYYPFLQEVIFGAHLYLIVLFFLPVYALFQHPVTVLLLQTVFLGAAAYPLYLLALLKLDKLSALCVGLAYLLFAPLGFINLFETHFDSFTILPLFLALYFFEKNRFRFFFLSLIFCIACKENMSLPVFMFGIYAFFRGRKKGWVMAPMLLGLLWFVLSVKFIIPYFAKDAGLYPGGFIFGAHYAHLGGTIPRMLQTIIMHPIRVLAYAFDARKIMYLIQLFLPVGFLSFISPAALLMTLPVFIQNLLSSFYTHATIYYQYNAAIIPFIFASYIEAINKIFERTTLGRRLVLPACLGISIVSGISLKAPQMNISGYLEQFEVNYAALQKDKLLKLIPRDASVIATFQFLPKLAHRERLYSLHFVSTGVKMFSHARYEPPEGLQYALIDFNEPLLIGSFFPVQAPQNLRNFLESGRFSVLDAFDDIVLFRKDYPQGGKICEMVRGVNIAYPVGLNIDDKLIFLGYDIKSKNAVPGEVLRMVYYWGKTSQLKEQVGSFLELTDAKGTVVLQKMHVPGYRIYPVGELPGGYTLKEEYGVLMPPDIKPGKYMMRIGVFSLVDGRILPASTNTAQGANGCAVIGEIVISGLDSPDR